MVKSGGKLIATGSKSCVIQPNINCKGEKIKEIIKKYQKLYLEILLKNILLREKEIDDIIKRIPGSKKWALIFDTLCKPPSFDDLLKLNQISMIV